MKWTRFRKHNLMSERQDLTILDVDSTQRRAKE